MVTSTGTATGDRADARPFLLRLGLAYLWFRAAGVLGALLLTAALRMVGAPRLAATVVVVVAVVAGVLAGREAHKRALWHREPDGTVVIPASVAGAVLDAGLVMAVAWVLTTGVGYSGVFPGAAVAKLAALALSGAAVLMVLRSRTPRSVVTPVIASLCAVVRVAAAVAAWLLADRVVPSGWRVQQALETGVVALVLVGLATATVLAFRRVVQGREDA
jgi:hypothetical protein